LSGEEGLDDASIMADYLPAIALMPQYRLWVASARINVPEISSFDDLWKFAPSS